MRHVSTRDAPHYTSEQVPLSQAVIHNDTVYLSGQVPRDPENEDRVTGETMREETVKVFENIRAILEASGTSLENVFKVTVFITEMDDYDEMNEVYREYMAEPYPARSTVEVSDLALDARVEIEVIAEL